MDHPASEVFSSSETKCLAAALSFTARQVLNSIGAIVQSDKHHPNHQLIITLQSSAFSLGCNREFYVSFFSQIFRFLVALAVAHCPKIYDCIVFYQMRN